ncbi:MAG: NACHT domain-containing protein [Anaerolineales bacterium]
MKKILDSIPPTIGLLMIVAGYPVYLLLFNATHDLNAAIVLSILYELVVLIGGFIGEVWQRLESKWVDRAADWLDQTLQLLFSGYRRRYLEYLVYQHRAFDVKGLTTQGPYSLALEGVYVELGVDPTTTSAASPSPVNSLPEGLRSGAHDIWQYLGGGDAQARNYAILGAPGSGKTTLLKHLALMLAAPANRRHKLGAPDLLPILLFLRDHGQAIKENPGIPLAQLVREQLAGRQAPLPPAGWLEKQLETGKCLILLDGLDEVAHAQTRKQVVAWVEQCMAAYGKNRFIISSRPHGYRSNPIEGVTVLQVRPFTGRQVEQFVHNWYLANEIMSTQKDDPGVREEARRGALDLLGRIRSTNTLADLAVNPLLLTMITTVHRYRSSLPGRRVELYAEIFEVFLGKRQQARGLTLDLTPAQKVRVLRALAYAMMEKQLRVVERAEALRIMSKPLAAVSPKTSGEEFLKDVENASGLLVEFESGKYSFSHLTFQEYLAALHIIEARLENEMLKRVDSPWWNESIRLYCAQADASQVVEACLNSSDISALSLAMECMDEAREVSPETRAHYDEMMEKGAEDPDPQRRKLIAAAWLKRRTR